VNAVTDLPGDVLESIGIKPFLTVQEAVDEAIRRKGDKSSVLFLPDGSLAVPIVE
jgi:hypothetical protein